MVAQTHVVTARAPQFDAADPCPRHIDRARVCIHQPTRQAIRCEVHGTVTFGPDCYESPMFSNAPIGIDLTSARAGIAGAVTCQVIGSTKRAFYKWRKNSAAPT